MAGIDYNSLRQSTLGSGVDEEAVTVNTRALIDKVLARYSGEHTTLRELLQNAADAGAKNVEIRYETVAKEHTSMLDVGHLDAREAKNEELKRVLKSKCRRILVKNDGVPFREEDWQRLKRIAEGNPDETKIGAFGVGFYSVFDECEEPFVSSGSQAMAFYWKGNQLFTRRAQLPQHDPMTTFLLEYRQPADLPPLASLAQFLATSLTFVSLQQIELYVDNHVVCSLKKQKSPETPLSLPSSISPSQRGTGAMIKIVGVDSESVQITANIMALANYKEKPTAGQAVIESMSGGFKGFWQRLAAPTSSPGLGHVSRNASSHSLVDTTDLSKISSNTIFLRIATANLQSSVSSTFAANLERATKKPPPRRTQIAILTMSKEEMDASESAETKSENYVFANVLPTKLGKIFIGFATHQTTAIRAHFAAHSVIPTVERESIDFNARYVKEWNAEMLRMAGILARIVYYYEMSNLRARIQPSVGKHAQKDAWHSIGPSVTHLMNMFTFVESTPSPVVGQIIEEAFWQCSNLIDVLSTKGILPSSQVRIIPAGAEEISGFLEGLPLLPPAVELDAAGFVKQLRNYNFIQEFSLNDMKRELEDRALTGGQMVVFLKWLAKKRLAKDLSEEFVQELLKVAVATSSNLDDNAEDGAMGAPVMLSGIKYFVTPTTLPPEMPTPPDCIPFSLTKTLKREELLALGWTELDLTYWAMYMSSPQTLHSIPLDHNLALSPPFASQFHAILSKNWDRLSTDGKNKVTNALKAVSCVPSTKGMRKPGEAYFPTVKIFNDLAIIQSMAGVKEKYLVALGVRKTLELSIVLERLQAKGGDAEATWSAHDLIKYFTSVSQDIPSEDIQKLKQTAFCKAENDDKKLYRAAELFVPKSELRDLECPIIQWPGGDQNWRNGQTAEEKFIMRLGLNRFPDIQFLLSTFSGVGERDATKASAKREKAIKYFIANYNINGYNNWDLSDHKVPFLPLETSERFGASGTKLAIPSMCFTNPSAAVLSVPIIRQDLKEHAGKFGVKVDPSMEFCVNKLVGLPPKTEKDARTMFGYFSTRLYEINSSHIDRLGRANIIPLMKNGNVRYSTPRNCFIGGSDSAFKDVFDFVDFGTDANLFLQKVGTKNEPTISEIAYMLTRDAERLLASCESDVKYLNILRRVAEAFGDLKQDRVLLKAMKKSRFLLATIEKSSKEEHVAEEGDYDDEKAIKEYQLASADEVVVVDDFILFNIFKGDILACPQEEALETFYTGLGSSSISKQVQSEWTIGRILTEPKLSKKLRDLCLERCRLFFHNNNSSVKHDIKWLEQNLDVWIVSSIKLRRTLQTSIGGHSNSKSYTEKTSAAIVNGNKEKNGGVLHVTADYNVFDVAAQLMKLILVRPKPHSALLLESLLSTDLYTLRNRGYNVDRILRLKKEAEARVAEEQKRRMIEAKKRENEENDRMGAAGAVGSYMGGGQPTNDPDRLPAYTENPSSSFETPEKPHKMPGAFFDSPEENRSLNGQDPHRPLLGGLTKKGGLFSQIKSGLGLDRAGEDHRQSTMEGSLGGLLGNNNPQNLLRGPQPTTQDTPDDGDFRATDPNTLAATLRNAVNSGKPFGSSTHFSQPQTNQVKEQNTYCDAKPSTDLVFFGELPVEVGGGNGVIKMFLVKGMSETEKMEFGERYKRELIWFGGVIAQLSKVFETPLKNLQIYYDTSRTIAFNTSGSLFCNFSYFLQLHADQFKRGASADTADAIAYWFMVLCHELAHNLVADHSAAHSYYTESFATGYLRRVIPLMIASGGGSVSGGGSGPMIMPFGGDLPPRGFGGGNNAPGSASGSGRSGTGSGGGNIGVTISGGSTGKRGGSWI